MAKTNLRGNPMTKSVIVKLSNEDAEALDLVCKQQGTSKSGFMRNLLIAHRVIPAFYN